MIDPAGLPPRPLPDSADGANIALGHGQPRHTDEARAATADWFGTFPSADRSAILGGASGAVPPGVEEAAARVLARLGSGG